MYKTNKFKFRDFLLIKFKKHKNDYQIALKFSEFFSSVHISLHTSSQQSQPLAAPCICIENRQI